MERKRERNKNYEASTAVMIKPKKLDTGNDELEDSELYEFDAAEEGSEMLNPKDANSLSKMFSESRFLKMSFDERQKSWMETQKLKDEAAKITLRQEEQSECTFVPNITSHSRRNLEEFLKDQAQFVRKRNERLQHISSKVRSSEEKEIQEKPSINAQSIQLTTNRNKESIHDRLFQEKLFETALKPLNFSKPQKSKQETEKNHACYRAKMKRELLQIINGHFLSSHTLFSYSKICEILQEFGMLKENKASQQQVALLWQILEGEPRKGVAFESLFTLICAIMKVGPVGEHPRCSTTISSYDSKVSCGKFDKSGTFSINDEEAQVAAKRFDTLYLNKINYLQKKKKIEVPSAKPLLNKKSNEIA